MPGPLSLLPVFILPHSKHSEAYISSLSERSFQLLEMSNCGCLLEAVNTLSLIQIFMESEPGSVLGAVGDQRGMRQDSYPQGITAETEEKSSSK